MAGSSPLTDHIADISANVPPLANYCLATASGTATLKGFFVDMRGNMVGSSEVSYSITTTPTTLAALAGGSIPLDTLNNAAVGFVGALTASVYYNYSGNQATLVTPACAVFAASTQFSLGRVG